MAFNEQEQQIISYGRANGKTRQEIEGAIANLRAGIKPKQPEQAPPESPSTVSRFTGILGEQAKKFGEVPTPMEKAATILQTPLKVGGELARVAGEQIAKPITAGAEALSNTEIIKKIAESPEPTLLEKIASTTGGTIKGILDSIRGKVGEEVYKSLADSAELLTLAVGGKGAKIGTETAMNVAKESAQAGLNAGKEVVGAIGEATKPVVDVTKMAIQGATKVPERIATNLAEKQLVEQSINKLPTQIAKNTARNGIDVADVKSIYQIPESVKPQARELVKNVIKFSKKETNVDPIEIVGKPIVSRLKELESLKGKVGQQLGEASKNLGVVTSEELVPEVFKSLKGVRGLEGLTVDNKGILNFKNTVLTTAETASDRKAIQSIYSQATRWGNGEAKHKLRQELFEILGGKKKAGVQLTDTQDKAYQAIRQGLSNVLDTKDPTYKALNLQFAKIAEPVNEIRKAIQATGATEDVLDMNAGLLARRLTSTSLSQGKIRSILEKLDTATGNKGNLRDTVEASQSLYNLLGKYYDLAPSTGFQGQVRAGIESTRGISEAITGAVKEFAGETTAVRQKALEQALKEALGI